MLNFIRFFLGKTKNKTQKNKAQQLPQKNREVWDECGLKKEEFEEAFKKSPRGWYQ